VGNRLATFVSWADLEVLAWALGYLFWDEREVFASQGFCCVLSAWSDCVSIFACLGGG
jgi:hypothetical protein